MLKITRLPPERRGLTIRLEGELLGPWVGSVRDACATRGRRPRCPDLAAVTYVDAAGVQLLNDLVAQGQVKAPIVIGRDHLDAGSVASPYRETEAMRDGSDAIADWPILNALLNTASGASWVSVHHGGGVGMGLSIHAGMVSVADGTPEAAQRLARVLTNDPGSGVMRHADAGYPEALACAREKGLKIPGVTS